jgi:hypothetical protein
MLQSFANSFSTADGEMHAIMTNHLFVAQLPRTVTVPQLQALFAQVGTVISVMRPRDKETGEYRSFAFVTMATAESAADAVERLNGLQLEGSAIVVKFNEKPPPAFAQKVVERAQNRLSDEPRPPAPRLVPDITWETRGEIAQAALAEMGAASNLKMTLIGRPGRIEMRGSLVVVGMHYAMRNPSLPKGVPVPPSEPTPCLAYIAAKQWRRVADSIQNPDDVLIIEGFGWFDGDNGCIALLATSVSTKLQMQAQRVRPDGDGGS